MGQSKSKHIYAFQPLPWPEALTAFRLIDQICGIASTFATTHLDKHATVVLDKVSELQRLPYLWDAFEADFERLRGIHMVRLATELHSSLEKLEDCKYDMGLLAEKDLKFKSRRQAAEKALVILRQVEEAHRAFHYAFELALYGSIRREQEEARELHGPEKTPREDLSGSPNASVRRAAAGGRTATASSGGGTAVANLRRALTAASAADVATRSPVGSPPPPPPAPEDSWVHDGQPQSPTPLRPASPGRSAIVRQLSIDAGEILPALPGMPRPLTPVTVPRDRSPAPRRPQTADAGTISRKVRQVTASPERQPLSQSARQPLSRSHSMTRQRHDSGPRGRDRAGESAEPQYVVMYMPQGPDGGGPRALLVPADALQPAPNSPGPAVAATTVMDGVSPFATSPGAAYAALPAQHPAAAAWSSGGHYLAPMSPALPQPQQRQPHKLFQQQQQHMAFTYPPSSPPPPPVTAPLSPPLVPYRTPPAIYGSPYHPGGPAASHLTHTYSIGSAGSSLLSPYLSSPHGQPASYRYYTPPPGTSAPSLHTAPAGLEGLSSSRSCDKYGIADMHGGTLSPAASLTASGTPNLNAFFDRPNLSGGGSSGGWLSPLAAVSARPPAPAGIASGVLPGSMMMLQPVSAHATAMGGVVLQPQSSPMQQPMLVMATGAGASLPVHDAGGSGNTSDGARPLSSGRVRFLSPDGGGSGGRRVTDGNVDRAGSDDIYGDDDLDGPARGSDSTSGSHHTYTYGPQQLRVQRAVPSFLAPYGGVGGNDVDYLPDILETHGSGRVGRRYSDGGGGNMVSRNAAFRDRSGGNAKELVNHFRGKSWEEEEDMTAAAGSRRLRSSFLSTHGPLSRDTEVTEARRIQQHTKSARTTPLLSYERLAALAGLDPEVLGGGAASGLASRGGHGTVQQQRPRKASPGAASSLTPPLRHAPPRPIQLVPLESSLRRAELLSEAVEGGDWAAAVELAGLVRGGWWGDSRDGAVARGLLLQAALRGGSADAHAALGRMAEQGEGLPGGQPDLAAAARHYSAAAAGGHRDATTAFAYLLEHGLGVQQNETRAAQLYASAAQRNCPTAANNLAKMILDGRGATAAATVAAAAAAAAATSRKGGAEVVAIASTSASGASQAAIARALLKRAARAGSASAWYNLGVCYLQQLKQQGPIGGGAPLAAAVREEVEIEALRNFAEAAKRGHARAALRAGYLHLQRSAAAAAVESFCAAALNTAAARVPPPSGAPSDDPSAAISDSSMASGSSGAAAAAALAGTAVEAEALWCLAQLAERQAAVLEVKKSSSGRVAGAGNSSDRQGHLQDGPSDDDAGAGSRSLSTAGNGGDGGGIFNHTEEEKVEVSRRHGNYGMSVHIDGDGAGGGGGVGHAGAATTSAAEQPTEDDASSTHTGGTENRAVGQLLATLAGSANIDRTDGTATAAAAAAAAAAASVGEADGTEDSAAVAAVRFAKEICRLDFSCCHRPSGQPPFTVLPSAGNSGGTQLGVTAPAAAATLPIRGLRRLRHQARDIIVEDAASSDAPTAAVVAAAATPSSVSETSTADGGVAPMASALARLELELQQPAERARRARRAAAELMAAAAALGHAAAQHWLAGWRWSMGQQAAAVVLWEAAGRRGHGASLLVLGQMAEAGQLSVAEDKAGGGGADLASAAKYYLRAQEAGAPGAVEAMRRVQKLLQRHVALQGKLEAVAAVGTTTGTVTTRGRSPVVRRP